MKKKKVKHPNVSVRLTGTDGNAFAIMAKVRAALTKAGASPQELNSFVKEATSGDYDNLLQTCMRWVVVS